MVFLHIDVALMKGVSLSQPRAWHVHRNEGVFIQGKLKAGPTCQIVLAALEALLIVHLLYFLKLPLEVDHLHFKALHSQNFSVVGEKLIPEFVPFWNDNVWKHRLRGCLVEGGTTLGIDLGRRIPPLLRAQTLFTPAAQVLSRTDANVLSGH